MSFSFVCLLLDVNSATPGNLELSIVTLGKTNKSFHYVLNYTTAFELFQCVTSAQKSYSDFLNRDLIPRNEFLSTNLESPLLFFSTSDSIFSFRT